MKRFFLSLMIVLLLVGISSTGTAEQLKSKWRVHYIHPVTEDIRVSRNFGEDLIDYIQLWESELYWAAEIVIESDSVYKILLISGKVMYLPIQWTWIEEDWRNK